MCLFWFRLIIQPLIRMTTNCQRQNIAHAIDHPYLALTSAQLQFKWKTLRLFIFFLEMFISCANK